MRRERSGVRRSAREGTERASRDELMRAADPVEEAEEITLRPRRLDEFVGQPRLKEHLEILLGAARGRGQAADHLLFAGPPGLGKTTLVGHRRRGDGRRAAHHQRSRARARRRPRRHPHQPRRRRRALHRRDPPSAASGRRGALPGDGGLPARHRDRQGPGGALDPARPPALHARRRHHPHRPHHRSAARPLRLRRPPRLLRRRRPRRHHRARRAASSACRSSPKARARSPAGPGARPASPTGC